MKNLARCGTCLTVIGCYDPEEDKLLACRNCVSSVTTCPQFGLIGKEDLLLLCSDCGGDWPKAKRRCV